MGSHVPLYPIREYRTYYFGGAGKEWHGFMILGKTGQKCGCPQNKRNTVFIIHWVLYFDARGQNVILLPSKNNLQLSGHTGFLGYSNSSRGACNFIPYSLRFEANWNKYLFYFFIANLYTE